MRAPRSSAGGRAVSRYAWVLRFPRVLTQSFRLKWKNRGLATDEGYAIHQRQFFGAELTENGSDKFSGLRRRIAGYAFFEGCQRALDVATGHGFQAKALRDAGIPQVAAVDLVAERIERGRALFPEGIDFEVMDAAQLRYPDKHFDSTTICAALHDMPNTVKRKVIAEVVRVTRRTVVIFEPRTPRNRFVALLYGAVGGIFDESLNFASYVREDLSGVLKENGLRIERDENVWFWLMNIKVCRTGGVERGRD